MHNHMLALGEIVKNRRTELGLTQSELAEKIDVDPRTILNIENQKGNPKMEVLFPLIRELKIDPVDIFYPELSRESSELKKLKLTLAECSDAELQALIPICDTVISVLRAKQSISTFDE